MTLRFGEAATKSLALPKKSPHLPGGDFTAAGVAPLADTMFPGQHYSTFVPQYSYGAHSEFTLHSTNTHTGSIKVPPDEWQEEPDYAHEGEGSLEEERDAWFEFRSVPATHLEPTTACAFDPLEELLWTGSASVCLSIA